MSKDIWHDCKKQPPLVDDGELVLMDSNGKFWVGFCEITSDGVSYFANNAEPLKNDFVKYARIDKLIASETDLERTRKALEVALDWLEQVATFEKCDDDLCREFTKRKLVEIKTALEQKDK